MRSQHVIIGLASLVLAGCARLVPPDSIIALDVGPDEVNVVVGATQPLRMIGTRGDGRTVELTASEVRLASSDTLVAQVTRDGTVKGVRLGRASVSATLALPSGPVFVKQVHVAVGALPLVVGSRLCTLGAWRHRRHRARHTSHVRRAERTLLLDH